MTTPIQIVITRTQQNDIQTLGTLEVFNTNEKLFECKTLELPWKNNKQNISCIPNGHYFAKKHISPTFGKSIWIKDVKERSEILIHKGNFYSDIKGCILVGEKHIDINSDGYKDVTNSTVTMEKLYNLVKDPIYINIIE